MLSMKFSCILLAGGMGNRFGSKKQYAMLHGVKVWKYAYTQCRLVANEIIVVGRDVLAGKTRQESVRNGLAQVTNPVVVIVEAVRPLVTSKQILTLAKQVSDEFPSWAYAMPSNYTIYDFNRHKHLDRKHLYFVQVPQAFKTSILIQAHQLASSTYTSDTQLIETVFGYSPRFLFGGMNLHKITYKEDLKMIEGLL